MKKLLLVALMAVSACAWADVETYSMTITVQGFTHENVHELPSDTIMRLVDNNGNVWMKLGVGDLSEGEWDAGIGKLELVLNEFLGETEQVPPKYSAIKVGGKKLYEIARKGQKIEEIKPRKINIKNIELLETNATAAKI